MIFVFIAAIAIVAAAPAADAKADAKPEAKPLIVAAAAPLAYTAPLVSSYNGLAVSAPLVASPYAAYNAYSPYSYSPYAAYPSAYTHPAAYVASPYTAAVVV